MLIWPLATTAWHILRLQIRESPPAGGLRTYQEDMDSRQGVVLPKNSAYYKMLHRALNLNTGKGSEMDNCAHSNEP
jgi:hypothetical protein